MLLPRQARLPETMLTAIEQVAIQEDRSVSGMVRVLLREALERRGVRYLGASDQSAVSTHR